MDCDAGELDSEASQCTFWCSVLSDGGESRHSTLVLMGRLNAPSGAQCFPTCGNKSQARLGQSLNAPSGAQCFPTRSTFECKTLEDVMSQCTFWCSVLSDSAPRKPRHNAVYRNEIAADLESTTSNRLAPVQLNHTTAKNRHKTTQRRRRPLPASTPPTSNEPKPKNRRLTTTSR